MAQMLPMLVGRDPLGLTTEPIDPALSPILSLFRRWGSGLYPACRPRKASVFALNSATFS